ncbi:hypothetical protein [Caballeronia sp. SBC1]
MHLAGQKGLPALLRERGCKIEKISLPALPAVA